MNTPGIFGESQKNKNKIKMSITKREAEVRIHTHTHELVGSASGNLDRKKSLKPGKKVVGKKQKGAGRLERVVCFECVATHTPIHHPLLTHPPPSDADRTDLGSLIWPKSRAALLRFPASRTL